MPDDDEDDPGKLGGPTTGGRFQELIAQLGGAAKVARHLGVSRNTIYDWGTGNTKLPFSAAVEVTAMAGVSLDWLARRPPAGALMTPASAEEFVSVPRLDVQASAGQGRVALPDEIAGDGLMMLRQSWLRSLGASSPTNVEMLEAKGDSMEPTIKDGDVMLIDRGYARVFNGLIFTLVVSEMVIVKRLQLLATGGLQLISDNPRYPIETVAAADLDTLSIVGRVIWFGRAI